MGIEPEPQDSALASRQHYFLQFCTHTYVHVRCLSGEENTLKQPIVTSSSNLANTLVLIMSALHRHIAKVLQCKTHFIASSYESISVYEDDCAGGGECYKYLCYCKGKLPPEGVGKRASVLKNVEILPHIFYLTLNHQTDFQCVYILWDFYQQQN